MKKLFILCLIVIFSMSLVYAQRGPKGPHSNVTPKIMQEFQTKVLAVEYSMPEANTNSSLLKPKVKIRILNKTENKEVSVILAPQDYLMMKNFTLKQGDKIKIKLEKMVNVRGEAMYFAYVVNKIIVKGNNKEIKTLKLRDESGKPLWIKNTENSEYRGHRIEK